MRPIGAPHEVPILTRNICLRMLRSIGGDKVERKLISSGVPWELTVGYSRAVRVGNLVAVAGTIASDESGAIVGDGDAYAQTAYVLRKIERALHEAGTSLRDVVRTRIFVTDISRWEEIGRAHGEFFREIRPAATMVEVSRFITPAALVEIEAEAVIQD